MQLTSYGSTVPMLSALWRLSYKIWVEGARDRKIITNVQQQMLCSPMPLPQVTDQYNEHWRTDWIASDFWYLLNFIFLCVVCWLFRPSQQAARYTDLEGAGS